MTKIIQSTDGLSGGDLEAQRQHFQSIAPSCLEEFYTKPAKLESHEFDGHGEELNSYWEIICRCGSEHFSLEAYSVIIQDSLIKEPVLASPIRVICDDCDSAKTIFDSNLHGYNPVACGGSCSIYGPDISGSTKFVHSCRLCNGTSHKVSMRFEYPGDLFDDGMDEFKGRETELFTWFSCLINCLGCGTRVDFASFECA